MGTQFKIATQQQNIIKNFRVRNINFKSYILKTVECRDTFLGLNYNNLRPF